MNNPMLEKLKNPKYAIFFVIRMIFASFSSATSLGGFSDGEIINGILWMIICVQFLFDGDTFKDSFKISRSVFFVVIFTILISFNFDEVRSLFEF